jgi:hypothetical protein
MCVKNKLVINWLNLNLSLAGPSWPLYKGGQVSRIRSGSIQIISSRILTMSIFGPNIYYTITQMGPRGTKIMGISSYQNCRFRLNLKSSNL